MSLTRYSNLAVCALALASAGVADTKKYPWVSEPNALSLRSQVVADALNLADASINREYAEAMVRSLIDSRFERKGSTGDSKPRGTVDGDYFVIHVLRWKDPTVAA